MKKPLIIFFGYQETHNASAQIARTFWEHVPRNEFEPTIICAPGDNSSHSVNKIVLVKENILIRFFFKVLRRIKLKDLVMIPDIQYYSWNKRVRRQADKLLKTGAYDYIHTIATPMSSHLIGVSLKKEFRLPLIIQCNDPWHDTSGRQYKYQWCATKDLAFERKAAQNADIIIHSNQVIADIWAERYGKEIANKINVVPFSFNIYDLPKLVEQKRIGGRLNISHIGNIYSTRSSLTIFKGIELLINEHPEMKDKFFFRFIGEVHQSEMEYVKNHGLLGNIEYLGSIAPEELESYYLDADIFLIIDVVIKRNPNYPSKLMMYYYYRKPILALTTQNSNLEKELLSSGHSICYYDDADSIRNFLYSAITDYDSLLHFNKEEWKKHTVENVESIYSGILTTLLG